MSVPYYSFNRYLRTVFGFRLQRIGLNAGFGCPNFDGTLSTRGCVFCDNRAFGVNADTTRSLSQQIEQGMAFYRARGIHNFIAYFQSYTSTHASASDLFNALSVIQQYPEIKCLCISTRPDCVDEKKLDCISHFAKNYLVWIEYGLQTTHGHLLASLNRNHTYADFLRACALSRARGINVGVHMMLGIPGQTEDDVRQDACRLSALDIQGIKFHVLHVLKNTPLAAVYEKNPFSLLSRDTYVRLLCDYLEYLSERVVVLRLVSSAPGNYLVAPEWMLDKQEVLRAIEREFSRRQSHQGSKYATGNACGT